MARLSVVKRFVSFVEGIGKKEMNCHFEIIEPVAEDWQRIASSPDCTCFHTEGWFEYLRRIHRKPFVVKIESEDVAGYFIGAKRWLGINMVESPAVSTGSYTTGLCMMRTISAEERVCIYQMLYQWLRKKLHVKYMQVSDWQFHTTQNDPIPPMQWHHPALDQAKLHYAVRSTFYVDTRRSETELWDNLSYKSCKYSINKARKEGLEVRSVDSYVEIPAFVELHRQQIEDVFSRKGMKPMPYQKKEHLLALCQALFPDNVLMLKVMGKDEDGVEQCMSTAIFCPGRAASTYFTGASFRQYMKYCPNELMVWEGMRMLHEKGAGDLIFTGVAHYKKKFGSSYAYLPVLVFTPYAILFSLRNRLKRFYGNFRNFFKKS
ncbi:MAG: hypothetical protein J5792_04480 [Bacteroidales bacterium]|nr:hypothetical protein [Bacteroidales bacterium]